jgi:hypothetical protein
MPVEISTPVAVTTPDDAAASQQGLAPVDASVSYKAFGDPAADKDELVLSLCKTGACINGIVYEAGSVYLLKRDFAYAQPCFGVPPAE